MTIDESVKFKEPVGTYNLLNDEESSEYSSDEDEARLMDPEVQLARRNGFRTPFHYRSYLQSRRIEIRREPSFSAPCTVSCNTQDPPVQAERIPSSSDLDCRFTIDTQSNIQDPPVQAERIPSSSAHSCTFTIDTQSNIQVCTPLTNDQPPRKKPKVPDPEMDETYQAIAADMKKYEKSLQSQDPELYHLTNVWAHKLLKISPSVRAKIEQQINKVIYNALEESGRIEELSASTSSDCPPSTSVQKTVQPTTSQSSESVANDSTDLSTDCT